MKNKTFIMILVLILVAAGLAHYLLKGQTEETVGSIIESQEYQATTTPWLGTWTNQSLKVGRGSLGSVIITDSGGIEFLLLDSTTTPAAIDDWKPSGGTSTSTRTLAYFPPGTAVGTYVFDTWFQYGLYLYVEDSATNGTSTITFR